MLMGCSLFPEPLGFCLFCVGFSLIGRHLFHKKIAFTTTIYVFCCKCTLVHLYYLLVQTVSVVQLHQCYWLTDVKKNFKQTRKLYFSLHMRTFFL